jgi:aminopeptidase-like protein
LPEGQYEVFIDAELIAGSLTYGELILPGSSGHEVLVTTHICHPAMANDNTTGIVLAAELAGRLARQERRHTYRFLFIPGTIGSITWLAQHQQEVGRIAHGLVLTGLGDSGGFVYKRSRRADAVIDRAVAKVLADRGCAARLVDFSPYGYDERQFCSPGFNLPVGRLSRSEHGTYPEYHTSADNLDFVSADALSEAFGVLTDIVFVLENDGAWTNLSPYGEPQLGRRGLYRSLGATIDQKSAELALLWVLNYSDGEHSLLDIATRSGLAFTSVVEAARLLADANLLKRAD